jgi:hypothetical protein
MLSHRILRKRGYEAGVAGVVASFPPLATRHSGHGTPGWLVEKQNLLAPHLVSIPVRFG